MGDVDGRPPTGKATEPAGRPPRRRTCLSICYAHGLQQPFNAPPNAPHFSTLSFFVVLLLFPFFLPPPPYPPPASSSSSNPADRLLSSHLRNTCSSQVEMEVMKEMMLCSSVHDKGFPADKVNDDDGWGSEKGNPLSEDFLVDDLLDLRGLPESEEEEEEEEEDMDVVRVSEGGGFSTEKTFTASQNEPPELYSEITLQETDAASLEWLSHFFDECSTEFPSPARPSYFGMLPSLPAQTPLVKYSSGCRNPAGVSLSSTATAAGSLSTEGLIPVKAKRSKRLRGNGALWSRSGQLRLADSSSASSITTFSSASPSSSYSSSSSSFNSYISYEPSSAFAGFLLDDMEAQPKGHNPKKGAGGRRTSSPSPQKDDARTAACIRRRSGAPGLRARRLSATRAASGSNPAGCYLSTGRRAVRPSSATSTQTATGKCWRCAGRRMRRSSSSPPRPSLHVDPTRSRPVNRPRILAPCSL
ncbi:hypothetical protein KSP40_PGU014635 [Platanthera guangdongensis]|uniref:Uncharacterized protein n=1 Tax=Platanthera guangdongensis TaxID=2320717 RepID=A0ABR2MZQ5_9ASPA